MREEIRVAHYRALDTGEIVSVERKDEGCAGCGAVRCVRCAPNGAPLDEALCVDCRDADTPHDA